MALNFPENPQFNDIYSINDVTWQWNGVTWNVVSSPAAADIPNGFQKVAVSGQSDVVADTTTDTLNIAAGSNIVITTDSETDTVTIGSTVSGGGDSVEQNLWATVAGDSGSTTANTATDTLTIAGGSSIGTVVSGDTLTVNFTGSTGATVLTALTDVSAAGVSVDEIYLPAITRLEVTNNGVASYRFDQYGLSDNPTIYVISGTTIAFKLNAQGHPFLIQDGTATNYNTGLIHVSTTGTVSSGADAQGKDSGTLYWKVPETEGSPPNFRYQCSVHAGMVGAITIKRLSLL